MAKRVGIGRGFAAVINYLELGPTVVGMARGSMQASPCPAPFIYLPPKVGKF